MKAPKKLIPISEVARRAGVCPFTASTRLHSAGVEPAAILVRGSQSALLFSLDDLPNLLRAAKGMRLELLPTLPETAV